MGGIMMRRWMKNPTWFDFIIIVIGWSGVYGISILAILSTQEGRQVWLSILYIVLSSIIYGVFINGSYRHLKEHKRNKNN